ncbi:uncharacterized protein PV09_06419 [Verruconis gallopava]|uniref:ER-bound oxygenase mpaB/mpaB'/Rubber oxygenase catalytic domain-containing protein n=1 Tax=Verruconis gallopava TaxID=253628 RepID=A0A0D2ASY6_9PEZI|nr:uncharacterized protein PV09_06419 [Verruconis gallopava]KIW02269.1 hypothetical protein PV09_06419 [Verruconis gallopava]
MTNVAATGTSTGVMSEKRLPYAVTQDELFSSDFDPKSMKKIASELILLAGGAYAVLLQMAYPGVAKGVDEHSNFAYRPTDRLRTTMTFVYCMMYGTPEEKKTIVDWVHKAHSVVKGPDYSADDPDLQLWVAATLYGAATEIHEKFFGKQSEKEADKIYREYSIIATSLRVPADKWPKSRAAFWEYWNHMLETLEINQNAKNVCNDLCYNKHGPLWVRTTLPIIRVFTAEWLTPRMRQEYGLKRSPKAYKTLMMSSKAVYPALPKFIRHYPVRFYLKDMRKRMKKTQGGKWQ